MQYREENEENSIFFMGFHLISPFNLKFWLNPGKI
jgi:hypothetical protein